MHFGTLLETDHKQDDDIAFKYVMQDTGSYYFGARYTYQDLLENELVPFKFRAIIEHYIGKDTDWGNSLESHLYYMEKDSFSYKTFEQLKAKMKVAILVEKKSLLGKKKVQYEEKTMPISKFVEMNLAQKKAKGVIVREVGISKLALMSFSV